PSDARSSLTAAGRYPPIVEQSAGSEPTSSDSKVRWDRSPATVTCWLLTDTFPSTSVTTVRRVLAPARVKVWLKDAVTQPSPSGPPSAAGMAQPRHSTAAV